MKIAIIGLGEVGTCYAGPLLDSGAEVALCDTAPKEAGLDLARDANLPIHPAAGDWIGACDVVLSCVTGRHSDAVARSCLPLVRPGNLFADLTTAMPEIKRRNAEAFAGKGVRFADVAIMGPISVTGAATPLLAAGDGAAGLRDSLSAIGSPVEVLDVPAGGAIALKLLRSVLTKGLEALCIEMMVSAEKMGVTAALLTQFTDMDRITMHDLLKVLVRTHATHAARRLHEVDDAAQSMALLGAPSLTLPGIRDRFQATVDALESSPPESGNPSFKEALAWLTAAGAAEPQKQE